MKVYIKRIVFFTVIFLLTSKLSYSDETELVFFGHDFYFLNSFDIDVISKNVNFEINNDLLTFNGDYVLRNKDEKIAEIVLGIPIDNIENLVLYEKSNPMKLARRNESFIIQNYIYEHLPKNKKWVTTNFWLKAGETRIISIEYNSKILNDSRGIYTFNYINNIKPVNKNVSKVYVIFNKIKPNNIINISNAEIEEIQYNSNVGLVFNINNNGRDTRIEYELTEKLAVDRLDFSNSSKLKGIARLYRQKDYEGVIISCNEYILNPSDNSMDINQVKLVKAEAFKELNKYDNYFEIVKSIELNNLYPYRYKYKILFDIEEILNGEAGDPDIIELLKDVRNDLQDNNEFLGKWLKSNSKINFNIEEVSTDGINRDEKESHFSKYIAFFKLEKLVTFTKDNKLFHFIIIAIVFILGLFIGKKSKKNRRNAPYYTLRK